MSDKDKIKMDDIETIYSSATLIVVRRISTSTMTWLIPAVDMLGNKYWGPSRNIEKNSTDYPVFCEIFKVKP
jgi:hypothetical protein